MHPGLAGESCQRRIELEAEHSLPHLFRDELLHRLVCRDSPSQDSTVSSRKRDAVPTAMLSATRWQKGSFPWASSSAWMSMARTVGQET